MDKELVERLLTEIRKARRAGIKTEELLFLGDYDAIQDALIWMHDKGLIIGVPLDELGDNVGDIWLSTITTAGRDYLPRCASLASSCPRRQPSHSGRRQKRPSTHASPASTSAACNVPPVGCTSIACPTSRPVRSRAASP